MWRLINGCFHWKITRFFFCPILSLLMQEISFKLHSSPNEMNSEHYPIRHRSRTLIHLHPLCFPFPIVREQRSVSHIMTLLSFNPPFYGILFSFNNIFLFAFMSTFSLAWLALVVSSVRWFVIVVISLTSHTSELDMTENKSSFIIPESSKMQQRTKEKNVVIVVGIYTRTKIHISSPQLKFFLCTCNILIHFICKKIMNNAYFISIFSYPSLYS